MPEARKPPRRTPSPTRDEIVGLLGDVEDALVAAVQARGASLEDIAEAVRWATGDAEQLGKDKRQMSPAAEAIYDLLMSDPSFASAERER